MVIGLVLLLSGCSGPKPKGFRVERPGNLVGALAETHEAAAALAKKAPVEVKPDADELEDMTGENLEDAKKQEREIEKLLLKTEDSTGKLDALERENATLKDAAKANNWWSRLLAAIIGGFSFLGWAGALVWARFMMKAGAPGRKWILIILPIVGAAFAVGMLVTNYFWPLLIGCAILALVGVVLAIFGVIKVPEYTIAKNHN